MLSKKMAFSLTSLITIFALAFVVTPAMAQNEFKVTVTQSASAMYQLLPAGTLDTATIDVTLDIEFAQPVGALAFTGDGANVTVAHRLDSDGLVVTTGTAPAIEEDDDYDMRSGTKRRVTVTITPAPAGTAAPENALGEVAQVVIKVSSIASTNTGLSTDKKANMSMEKYHTITIAQPLAANTSRPTVVSIQRLRPGSQTVVAAFQEAEVTGPFDVRIVLTEKAFKPGKGDAINADDLEVTNGSASGWTVGVPFARVVQPQGGTGTTAGDADDTTIPHPAEGMYVHANDGALAGVPQGIMGNVPMPTGTDNRYHQYRVTITPHRRASEVRVHLKEFHDNASPYPNVYKPFDVGNKPPGREQLRLKVNIEKFDLEDGVRVYLPHDGKADFPDNGHYILTRSKSGSHINYFKHEDASSPDRENKAKEQTPAQLKYNVRETGYTAGDRAPTADAPQIELPNLEAFLANHGTIHLVSYVRDGDNPKYTKNQLYISEVMWGTDASQITVANSNWIEIHNASGEKIDVGEQLWALWFYEAHETPPTEYPENSAYEGPTGQAGEIIDIIGTKASDTGLSWSLTGKGQSGRSGIDIARAVQQVLTPTTPLISMYRMMDTDGTPSDGTLSGSWMQTEGPSVNLRPGRENAIIATPGAEPFDTPDDVQAAADAEKAKADADAAAAAAAAAKEASTGTYPTGNQGRVYVSEVMFAGGGTLPQWIEIANGDRATGFNLSGWTITVDNAISDVDVTVGARAKFTIPDGTTIDPSAQDDTPSTILVVTEEGRNNLDGPKASGQIINLDEDNEIELINAGVLRGKYTLLSDMAFLITLAPPSPAATKAPAGETAAQKTARQAQEKKASAERKAAMDMAGNLGTDGTAAWALPMDESGARSSIIRRHVQVARGPAAPEDGMMAENWILASNTSFAQVTHIRAQSYYGAPNDVGTPGFRAGGALPVELSHFRPTRDKATGQVVITWATESELNNAGFFIKRSQQRDGEFKVINATMIAGAGTTSEKQFYTYTDTTAQPNVVYYYQIEDISLDGNRQTLTRGIRLKGHIGAAGKATTLWGELKSSNE